MATWSLIFPHVLHLEQPFKPNKLEKFFWEKMVGRTKTKVHAYVFDGSLVEALLYCATYAIKVFRDMLFYPPMHWQAEFSKCLQSNEKEIYRQIQLDAANKGNPFAHTPAGFNRMISVFVQQYVTNIEARETQIKAMKQDKESAYNQTSGNLMTRIQRMQELIWYLPYLRGLTGVIAELTKKIIFQMFPIKWKESFMLCRTMTFHSATINQIKDYMIMQ